MYHKGDFFCSKKMIVDLNDLIDIIITTID